MNKWIYSFSEKHTQGSMKMKKLLGGKGANLAEMCLIGLPVPPGFTITTKVCEYFYLHQHSLPYELKLQIQRELANLHILLGSKFADLENPLLISVRSGSVSSMPGMMDTILNVGLNDQTVLALANKTNDERFAYDCYRRLIQMYSSVVLNIDHHYFEELLQNMKQKLAVNNDTEIPVPSLKELILQFKELVLAKSLKEFPQDVYVQLNESIHAVFKSWMNSRAITYRKINNISDELGTAVNIQAMVFGNMGNSSATGVAFTRNPSTGEANFYGEYLINAQGEDVVSGIRTPQAITKLGKKEIASSLPSMEEVMPEIYLQLEKIFQKLESHYQDIQDVEFTVENNKLWILQTRSAKRSIHAAIKIAVDMVKEQLITKEQAIERIDVELIEQLLHPTLDVKANYHIVAKGLPASPGAASGIVVFSSDDALIKSKNAEKVILVRNDTSPEDIQGMHISSGILTARGGMTSHAAVVARGMGKPCVCGAMELNIDYQKKIIVIEGNIIKEGDVITINGSTGDIILGPVPTIMPVFSKEFKQLMRWVDDTRKLSVRVNAETPAEAKIAINYGADGIGLCRTEHMFFAENRINIVRQMILAKNSEQRATALSKLLPMQKEDFINIFTIMKGLPVNIRLLDPPLHEFLPHDETDFKLIAAELNETVQKLKNRCYQLGEINPMLGHRGCRLGISFPEIYQMQVRAIFEAMVHLQKTFMFNAMVEIMIPLVMNVKELKLMKNLIDDIAHEVTLQHEIAFNYKVGAMIELPRAALMAGELAELADFFSFGTNDLTQTTLGISRDDAGSFLGNYQNQDIIADDPFIKLDEEGVGELINFAVTRARKTKADIKIGVCGEHGGDPQSIKFFHNLSFDYISCSAYRIPVAKLASAQWAIRLAKKLNKKQLANIKILDYV